MPTFTPCSRQRKSGRLRLTPMNWRALLKSRIKYKGITLREIADSLSVTEGAVSHWLSGRREPSIKTIRAMAALAGVSMQELFGDESRYIIVDESEMRLVEALRTIPENDREAALRMLAALTPPPRKI